MTVTEPTRTFIATGLSEAQYHAEPALSASGAKKLLPPSCPAKFRHDQLHGQAPKDEFDFGSTAHKLVLGSGPEIHVVEADSWRTKDARAERDAARADGKIPLLPGDLDVASAMAAQIKEHPIASVLFDPDRGGAPEQSLFWPDPVTDLGLRCRLDWLPESKGQRLVVPDYKTCRAADLRAIPKAVLNWRYYLQAAWYLDGVKALGLDDNPAFVFVFQEKEPPYLVTVVELDHVAVQVGQRHARAAIDLYDECLRTDTWPGYSDEIELVSLPEWFVAAEAGDLL